MKLAAGAGIDPDRISFLKVSTRAGPEAGALALDENQQAGLAYGLRRSAEMEAGQ